VSVVGDRKRLMLIPKATHERTSEEPVRKISVWVDRARIARETYTKPKDGPGVEWACQNEGTGRTVKEQKRDVAPEGLG
jgi:hypothetical protein